MMFIKISVLLLLHLLLLPFISFATTNDFILDGFKPPTNDFIFNGFKPPNGTFIIKDRMAQITSEGCLMLSNFTTKQQMGHAFYFNPIEFKNLSSERGNISTNATVYSFSTTFVFGIVPYPSDSRGQGIAFFISPTRGLPGAKQSQFLGLFNVSNTGNPANHVLAVELDTNMNSEYGDIDGNHVGIDINSIISNISKTAGYFTKPTGGDFENLNLVNQKLQVWVEYDGGKKQLDVTLAPFKVHKPNIPLLSFPIDLSPILQDYMYVGFSSGTGNYQTSNYILGWSFKINGQAQELNLSQLPKLPHPPYKHTTKQMILKIGLPIIVTIFVVAMICGVVFIKLRKRNLTSDVVIDDWEVMYHRLRGYSYKELYTATKGFGEKELVGIGGFGKVYKGILPTSKVKVAIKRVSHDSKQGMKEFIAEIVSIGQLRHRNLVKLMGYCRRKGELLLVYDLMPNGSLDKYLFGPVDDPSLILDWNQRFQIIKGAASGLAYLHEGCDQVVIHRDIKAGNVLLDGEMNARLGDFGLAKLCERGTNPLTTNVVGTLGYVAPELARTGKATTNTDVFGFGAFLHEVACGKRPIEPNKDKPQEVDILFDLVFSCWKKGSILEISDPKLGTNYVKTEMELVLKVGLLCCHNVPGSRPSMKQVLQYLDGDTLIPALELWGLDVTIGLLTTDRNLPRNEILEDSSLPLLSVVDYDSLSSQPIK